MAATKEIRRRIKSIKNTKKITKAMEMVSAAKMRKSVNQALSSRTYAQYAWYVLNSLSGAAKNHPLIKERPVKNITAILVTSDRGRWGSYNSQILKITLKELREKDPNVNWKFVEVCKKGLEAMQRLKQDVTANFIDLPPNSSLSQTKPISKLVIDDYINGLTDKVVVLYTDYVSALKQDAQVRQLLPLSSTSLKEVIDKLSEKTPIENVEKNTEFKFEPQKEKILPYIIEKLTHMQVYQMIIESNASEQSSRMMAMKNATEAAGEMIGNLTLIYNKARQSAITQEISEISAGSAAVE